MAREIPAFSRLLLEWYGHHKRQLPWRESTDAYSVWLSEVILQQTRVAQGLPYYQKFISAFPTVEDLARAKQQDVLSLWQGLGYYSRARNLHECARAVVSKHGGKFPATYEGLLKLKGIGAYTAAAIASISFNQRVPVIDGNVYRVVSRVFGVTDDISLAKSRRVFERQLLQVMPQENPGDFNQAIMEFGALQCVPANPACHDCPFSSTCFAFKHGETGKLPVKSSRLRIRHRFFHYFVFQHSDTLLFKERSGKDIWQGLYDFFSVEADAQLSEEDLLQAAGRLLEGACWELAGSSGVYKHVLTHQRIFALFLSIKVEEKTAFDRLARTLNLKQVEPEELERLPKPILITNFLKSYKYLFSSFEINR